MIKVLPSPTLAFVLSPIPCPRCSKCCACSCVDGDYECYSNGFYCRDPACFDPALVAEFPDCDDWLTLGDGNCDPAQNTPACGYDGGDVSCPCFAAGDFLSTYVG